MDRVVDFSFGQGEACYHLILELYAQARGVSSPGNVLIMQGSLERGDSRHLNKGLLGYRQVVWMLFTQLFAMMSIHLSCLLCADFASLIAFVDVQSMFSIAERGFGAQGKRAACCDHLCERRASPVGGHSSSW